MAATVQAPFSDSARTATRKVFDVLDPLARRRATELRDGSGSTSSPALPGR